jgi:hypothetical protein
VPLSRDDGVAYRPAHAADDYIGTMTGVANSGQALANRHEPIRLRIAMMQVEAVVKMLQPGFNVASIAAKRRNKSNPWFKRGTL